MTALGLQPLHLSAETFQLGNGLRVVVQADHSAPLIAVHLMYHAGSRHETPGRTGLAHLLEHLMFEGTAHCPKGQFDILLDQAGGTNNGSTWLDRTNYFETVPRHALELALWLERDRMIYLLPALSDHVLEVQRGVVLNERLESYENRPYGMADERLHQLLFPAPHPYSWPTIGYSEDLRNTTLADVRGFYQQFYSPANAVLVIAGDVDQERARGLADRYFGDLDPGGAAGRVEPLALDGHALAATPGRNDAPRAQFQADVLEDQVSFDRTYRAWPVPPYGTAEWLALDALAYLLADGESSRLQRALVREGKLAQDVDTYLYPTELAGIFGMVATARSGVDAQSLDDVLSAEISRIAGGDLEEAELHGAIRRVRRDQLAALADIEERAESLAYAAITLGDANRLEPLLNGYLDLTPEKVISAAALYLTRDSGARVSVIPRNGGTDEGDGVTAEAAGFHG